MTAPTTTPSAVRNATLAVWGLLALMVVRAVLTVAFEDDLVDAYVEAHPSLRGFPRDFATEQAPSYLGVSLVVLGIVVVLAVAATFLGKAANWARIVVYVFAALTIVGMALSFVAPSLAVLMLVNVLAAVLAVAAIVLLSTDEAKRFFAH